MRDNLPTRLRDAAKKWREKHKVVGVGEMRYDFALEEAADAIEELLPFKKQVENGMGLLDKADELLKAIKPRWIPVTERLPIRGDRVICFGDNGINIVDFVCGDKWCALPWFYLDGEQETGITHWMPLPEPPKEKPTCKDCQKVCQMMGLDMATCASYEPPKEET